MAQEKISELPESVNNLTVNDFIGVAIDNGDGTFTSKKIAKHKILGYRVYSALLTQLNEDAPTAIVLQNELNDEIVFSRSDTGVYSLTTTIETFMTGKTFVLMGLADPTTSPSIDVKFLVSLETKKDIILTTVSGSSTEDNCLSNTAIEIRVYN